MTKTDEARYQAWKEQVLRGMKWMEYGCRLLTKQTRALELGWNARLASEDTDGVQSFRLAFAENCRASLENGVITQEEYEEACANAPFLIEDFERVIN